MKVSQCDKCGQFYDATYANIVVINSNGDVVQQFDVCRECMDGDGILLRTKRAALPTIPPGGPNGSTKLN